VAACSPGRRRCSINSGFAVRLIFDTPVSGPLALRYGAHFGLGIFVATDFDRFKADD